MKDLALAGPDTPIAEKQKGTLPGVAGPKLFLQFDPECHGLDFIRDESSCQI